MNAEILQTEKEIAEFNKAIDEHTANIDSLKKKLVEKEKIATDALRASKASKYDDAEYALEKGLDVKTHVSKKTTALIKKEDIAYEAEVTASKAVDEEIEKRRILEEQVKLKEQELRLYNLAPQMEELFVMAKVTNFQDLKNKLVPLLSQNNLYQAPQ